MEVHTHTHPDSYRDRKKWTHYFWEFLMLFLAVFCGFLAENQREHFVEDQRAKVFARSLHNDMKTDTAELNRIIAWATDKENHIDSLIGMLNDRNKQNDISFSVHASTLVSISNFFPSNGTYHQMKNSGSLRYFKQALIDSLYQYENIIARVKLREDAEILKLETKIIPFVQTIINFEFFYRILHNEPLPNRVYVNLKDQAAHDLLNNYSIEIKSLINRRIFLYHQLKSKAIEILQMLKSKYHL